MLGVCIEQGVTANSNKSIGKVQLRLVAVQEVRLDRGDNQPAGDYTFFLWKWECQSSVRDSRVRTLGH
jgi:hypothetical protein